MNTDEVISYISDLEEAVEANPELLMSLEFREILKGDFRVFLHFVWQSAFGFTPHRIQLEFADLMQQPGDKILMAMRGFGKSIMDGTFMDWHYYKDQDFTVLVLSAARPRAMEITGMALMIIKACPFLTHLTPDKAEGDLSGRLAFTIRDREWVGKEASAVATSITSGNTGAHADLLLCDDIEIPKNSNSQPKREDIMKGVKEFTYIKNKPNGYEILIGTPQTEDSIYFKLAETGKYAIHRIPSEYPDIMDEAEMKGLAPFLLDALRADESLVGQPTYPERFPEEELNKQKAESLSTYNLQMRLSVAMSDAGRYPLKLKNFMVMDLARAEGPRRLMWGTVNPIDHIESVGMSKDMFYAPAFVDFTPTPYEHIIMGIDPAGSGADEVGYCIGAGIMGNVFILAAGGIDGGHDDQTLTKLAKYMIDYNVKTVRVEKNFGNGMYAKHLARIMGQLGVKAYIEPDVIAKGQKEVRIINTLEMAMGNHKIILDTRVAKDQVLMNQITRLTKDRGALIHDDRVDAMEMCVAGFTDSMIVDTDKLLADSEEQLFQDEIRGYMNVNRNTNHSTNNTSFLSSSRGNGKSWI